MLVTAASYRRPMPRARDLGIEIGRLPTGPVNAITDVPGLAVGHTTLIEGDDVRTGVTVVVPPPEPLFAASPHDQRQRRADRPRVDPRLGHADDADRADEHALRRRRPRRADRRGAAGRVGLEPPRRRRDVGRLSQRHQRLPRQPRARRGGTCRGDARGRSRRAPSAAAPAWSATASRAGSARPRAWSRTAGRSACSCRRTTAAGLGCG